MRRLVRSVSRAAVPDAVRRTWERVYPYSWLGILADVAPSTDELIYAWHPDGFAMHSMRSATVSRLYLQVPNGTPVEEWTDDRIWDALATRLGHGQDGWQLQPGPITEKSVLPMRSYVQTPMRHGSLFLAGDAAHIVPPTGAKGLNLAIADVALLAPALADLVRRDDRTLADAYSDTALRRVWRCTHFSWWMTTMLHTSDDPFDAQLQLSQLRWVASSEAGAAGSGRELRGAADRLLTGPSRRASQRSGPVVAVTTSRATPGSEEETTMTKIAARLVLAGCVAFALTFAGPVGAGAAAAPTGGASETSAAAQAGCAAQKAKVTQAKKAVKKAQKKVQAAKKAKKNANGAEQRQAADKKLKKATKQLKAKKKALKRAKAKLRTCRNNQGAERARSAGSAAAGVRRRPAAGDLRRVRGRCRSRRRRRRQPDPAAVRRGPAAADLRRCRRRSPVPAARARSSRCATRACRRRSATPPPAAGARPTRATILDPLCGVLPLPMCDLRRRAA